MDTPIAIATTVTTQWREGMHETLQRTLMSMTVEDATKTSRPPARRGGWLVGMGKVGWNEARQ